MSERSVVRAVAITALVATSACWLGHPSVVPTVADTQEASQRVDAYIDARFTATPQDTAALVEYFADHGMDAPFVERVLRGPRASYPAPRWQVGAAPRENPVDCFHVDYSSLYDAYVPTSFDPARPSPVLVVGHGGNSSMSAEYARKTAARYMDFYRPLAEQLGAVMVAPATERGWSPIGDSLIFSTLSDVARTVWIDPDRIYLTGQSMGGHLTWRTAVAYPDRYAAFAPMSGGYADWTDNGTLYNLWDTVGYFTWGQVEPYGLDTTNAKLNDFLAGHHYRWTGVQVPGEHPIADGEFGRIAAVFGAVHRDLYAQTLYFRGAGPMQYTANWQIEGWPQHTIRLDRPLMSNVHDWIRIAPRTDAPAAVQEIKGRVEGGNRIELRTNQVRHVTVMLHPAMGIDLGKPVTITVNGAVAYAGVVQPDLGRMLDLVRELDDRGRVFYGFVDLDVTTDAEVGEPWQP